MNPARKIFLGVVVGLALLPAAHAQFSSDQAVTAAGGGTSSAGPYTLTDTLGEEAVGTSASSSYSMKAGFFSTLNLAPIAAQDLLLRSSGGGKIRLASLLDNDTDPDADAISLAAVSPASNESGSVTIDNGWLLYSPRVGWSGPDLLTYTLADADGNLSTGTVLVQLTGIGNEIPRTMVHLLVLSDGTRSIRFAGIAGRSYSIQTTDDLLSPAWTEKAVRVAASNGLFDFVDVELPQPTQRYYRAIPR
jgi:hypothetical protein